MVEERRVRNSSLFLSESGSYVCFFGADCVGIITVVVVRVAFVFGGFVTPAQAPGIVAG